MEILTLITILTIYIIGVIVAYGLALGMEQAGDEPWAYEADRRYAMVICWGSWITFALLAPVSFFEDGRLYFQYRRKG